MLNVLRRGQGAARLEPAGPGWKPDPDVVWIDLLINEMRWDRIGITYDCVEEAVS